MDYELQTKVKNGRLLNVMRSYGYENAAQLSRACGVSQATIGLILNLKQSLYKRGSRGNIVGVAKPVADIATFLSVSPEDIIPPEMWDQTIMNNEVRMQMSSDQAAKLFGGDTFYTLESLENEIDNKSMVEKALAVLTTRERSIITKRMDGKNLFAIGREDLNEITPERVRQIEIKAMRKMKEALNMDGKYD